MNRLSKNALEVLRLRYLKKDTSGHVIESPVAMFKRVALAISQAEAEWGGLREVENWGKAFLSSMEALDFLPNSPTLMNAGTPLGQLSACFVLPVEDSIKDIFEAVKQMAMVQKTGGGTGFSFSKLRPKGSFIVSTGGEASGPVSFMKIFDAATENIKQGGRRRGANMGVLRVDHPDILEFITAKADLKALKNFNLSVGITDDFMRAYEADKKYDLFHPISHKVVGSLSAKEVFDRVVLNAWQSGDPGLLFLDAINRANPLTFAGEMEASNPCGEVPLFAFESCNLGSINLAHMLKDKNNTAQVAWDKLKNTVHIALRFLDDVIEVNHYPLPQTKTITQANRKVGLGVMGFAEMLIKLGISYASPQSIELARQVMKFIKKEAQQASQKLAQERGTFPNWSKSVYSKKGLKLRNATLCAIAPTGTLSILAETSPSIEPLFALVYHRYTAEGKLLSTINPIFENYLKTQGCEVSLILKSIEKTGSIREVKELSPKVKKLFACALEIEVDQHLAIQEAFQQYVDNSVSKTINLPENAEVKKVSEIYLKAWQCGLKGITVYRYGSKPSQVLELGPGERDVYYEHLSHCDPEECKL